MTGDPTVQVPVSLPTREQIAEAKRAEMDKWLGDATTQERAIASSWFNAGAAAVLALLSQPHPTAEPSSLTERLTELREPVNGHRPYCLSNQPGDGPCNCDMAEPPRIEDMAPGTKPCADPNVNRWYCHRRADGTCPLPKCIDPSTIRDVTPPAVTP